MLTWLKIGLRNLGKNRRRSLVTILAIAFGFAAVCLFAGFTQYMYHGNRDVAIYAQCSGHLILFKKGYRERGQLDPGRYLLSSAEIATVEKICKKQPHVVMVTPQLGIKGLLTNGRISTIFMAEGLEPEAVEVFFKHTEKSLYPKAGRIFESLRLDPSRPYGVLVASGLARLLGLEKGSDAVAFGTTVEGQMNALNAEIVGIFNAASELMNDKVMRVPLRFARELYDTQGAERLAVLLDDTSRTVTVRDQLATAFQAEGLPIEVLTWQDLNEWYRKVKELFDVIFAFLFTIVFIVVMMSVINTMSMTVLERTREIGTLRALGLKRRGVLGMFSVESVLLGLAGSLGGLLLTALGWYVTRLLRPTWTPPGMSAKVPIVIHLVPSAIAEASLLMVLLCLTASLIPARRAARQNIVEALGHV